MATAYFEILQWFDDDGPPQVSYRSKTLPPTRRMLIDHTSPEHFVKDAVRFWARSEIPRHILQMAQRVWVESDGVVQTLKDRTSNQDTVGQAPKMTDKEWFILKMKSWPL